MSHYPRRSVTVKCDRDDTLGFNWGPAWWDITEPTCWTTLRLISALVKSFKLKFGRRLLMKSCTFHQAWSVGHQGRYQFDKLIENDNIQADRFNNAWTRIPIFKF